MKRYFKLEGITIMVILALTTMYALFNVVIFDDISMFSECLYDSFIGYNYKYNVPQLGYGSLALILSTIINILVNYIISIINK